LASRAFMMSAIIFLPYVGIITFFERLRIIARIFGLDKQIYRWLSWVLAHPNHR